jgi:hypothetical protein
MLLSLSDKQAVVSESRQQHNKLITVGIRVYLLVLSQGFVNAPAAMKIICS